ncbi:HAMP domain-containing sensor histidine kinase [Kribbella sp. NPDC023855]|uniref:sensor histidine kinase n=1 Tax=Kribbella sp. NPDC023855 TaxID=3154698 RepID=UPI0033F71621
MRARLMGVLAIVSLVLLAALLLPFLAAVSDAQTQRLQLTRSAALDRFAGLADRSAAENDYSSVRIEADRHEELYGEAVLVTDASGKVVVSTGDLSMASPGVGTVADLAARELPQLTIDPLRPWSSARTLIATPVGSPHEPEGAVVLAVDSSRAIGDVRRLWLIICAAAIAAALLLLFMASRTARWVIRPVRQLEDAVVELGRSATWNQPLEASGPPELRRLARAVEVMGATVQRSIDVQRQMVADSSHQLRNPLASIRLRIDGLAPELRDPASPAFAHLQDDLERLEDVLSDLLKLAALESRVTDGRAAFAAEECLVGAVLTEELEIWRPAALAAGIDLVLRVSDGLVAAAGEHDLRQLIGALLDNAIKYAGSGATVVLAAARLGDGSIEVRVADDGPGLPAEQLELATQRFWRGGVTPLGTGLGLAIAEQTALAAGGRLELVPTEPHGLTAVITLPEATS